MLGPCTELGSGGCPDPPCCSSLVLDGAAAGVAVAVITMGSGDVGCRHCHGLASSARRLSSFRAARQSSG